MKTVLALLGLALFMVIGIFVWLISADIPSPQRPISYEWTDGSTPR